MSSPIQDQSARDHRRAGGQRVRVLRWIQQNAADIRIFTVGIDTAVNVSLLERIAQVSGGHFTLVNNEEQLDGEMAGLRRRINPPLLHQVSVQLPGAECSPPQVDLFQGLCARQMGHLRGALPQEVDVIGISRDGRAFRNRLPVTYCSGQTIHKMWAREHVLQLEHGFLAGWRQPAYQPAAIAQFALLHGVLCRFTAFVAVDDQSYVPGALHQVTQAVSQPAGWAQEEKRSRQGLLRTGAKAMFQAAKPSLGSSPVLRRQAAPAGDPFASSADPFAGAPPANDPFASVCFEQAECDAFAAPVAQPPTPARSRAAAPGWVPATPPAQAAATDPVQDALNRVLLAQTIADWDSALQLLIEALARRGFSLTQLDSLQRFRQLLASRFGQVPTMEAATWRQQVEMVVNALLHNTPPTRQDSFWM